MHGVSVLRDDGTRGKVIDSQEQGKVVVEFSDGLSIVVSPDNLTPQGDGSYRIAPTTANVGGAVVDQELTIPVIAEELTLETVRVARRKVRIHKRIETRRESVDAPTTREEVVVEHIPVNKFVDQAAPEVREENGVLVIPLIEEVLVLEKRLLLREEIRVSKRRTTTNTPQTIELRREIVDIDREELNAGDSLED